MFQIMLHPDAKALAGSFYTIRRLISAFDMLQRNHQCS
jgi:hypothetical protein